MRKRKREAILFGIERTGKKTASAGTRIITTGKDTIAASAGTRTITTGKAKMAANAEIRTIMTAEARMEITGWADLPDGSRTITAGEANGYLRVLRKCRAVLTA